MIIAKIETFPLSIPFKPDPSKAPGFLVLCTNRIYGKRCGARS
jgi:hypothetical protein